MPAFLWEIKYFANAAAFAAYLDTIKPGVWCSGITIHHTVIPTIAQWQGYQHMVSLGSYYRDDVPNPDGSRGWPSGPHLFVAPDGIWQGTPIPLRGTHAGVCNSSRIGIEIVGNYDKGPWQEPIKSLAFGTIAALCRWAKFKPAQINGHRDCGTTKTCPGSKISMTTIRSQVATMLAPAPPPIILPPEPADRIDPRLADVWVAATGKGHTDPGSGFWIPGPGLGTGPAVAAPDGNGLIQPCERMYIGIDSAGRPRFPLLAELKSWGIV